MLKILELFGGIGAFSKALENLDIDFEIVDYVEIDKYAVKSFNAIHGTNFEPQDIKEWNKDIEVDIIMHGSPCQDFSLSGFQAGGDKGSGTRSSLMYEALRIVEKLKPKVVIWENVKNLLSKKHKHNFDSYIDNMTTLGYNSYYQVLNAKDYGIPQNRERVYTISIRKDLDYLYIFPQKQDLKLRLKDMLEDNVEEKYYLSEKMIHYISEVGTKTFHNKDSRINLEIARPLTTEHGKRAGTTNYISEDLPSEYNLNIIKYGTYYTWKDKQGNYNTQCNRACDEENCSLTIPAVAGLTKVLVKDKINVIGNYSPSGHEASRIVDNRGIAPTVKENHGTVTATNVGLRIRRLTPLECFKLMGFTKEDFIKAKLTGNSDTQLYKQAGNSIVVNVLMEIIRELIKQKII